jgi:pilus assembly protein FimV
MMTKKLLDDRAGLTFPMAHPHPSPVWPMRMVAAAALLVLGAYGAGNVQALGLGRITVLSALGEPLRAEIEVPQVTPEEAATLKASIAGPAEFRGAGIEFNPALTGASISLQQRPDGRSYLRVSSDKPVNEPFVDLILEAKWASGQIVRNYTLLFDPPSSRRAVPVAPVAAQVPSQPLPAEVQQPRPAMAPRNVPMPAASQEPVPARAPAKAIRGTTPSQAKAAAPVPAREPKDGKQIKVQQGDTAGRIAASHKPSEVSLDQMLVALLRTNPNAFIDGNVNRIKAGALIDLPTAEQASSTTPDEARKTLVAQSASFNDYRRKLAGAAPARQVAEADRKASGTLQASVDDKKPVAASPDKLTLSKGGVKGKSAEAQIAESRQAKETTERVAALSKNIDELARLQEKSGGVPGAAAPAPAASGARGPALPLGSAASAAKPATLPAATASASGTPAGAAMAPASATPAPAAKASAPATAVSDSRPAASVTPSPTTGSSTTATASAAAPLAVASAPAATASAAAGASSVAAPVTASTASAPASKPKPVAAVKSAPPKETSFVDELLENPLVPGIAGGLIALLAGFGFYRARQRKKASQIDSSFLESRLQPDSFFGSSGGQRVDTADAPATGSSMAYSPSQLDAAGDVDPVAEADVYLAYGRDLQAEEILKEALKMNPSRIAIHGKLLEIYAKRRDVRAFETLANNAFKLSDGVGTEWDEICALGRELEPENSLYQPGGQPQGKNAPVPDAGPESPGFSSSTIAETPHPEFASSSMPVDLDLGELELSYTNPAPLSAEPDRSAITSGPVPLEAVVKPDPESMPRMAVSALPVASLIDAKVEPTAPELAITNAPEAPKGDGAKPGMIEFDLGGLSLELDPLASKAHSSASMTPSAEGDQDPLETKLALAQEFHAIGDSTGARAMVEEVVAKSSGPLKAKAQRFLAELG